jgi:hypothetical protein
VQMGDWHTTPAGRRRADCGLFFRYRNLPAAIGFEATLRLSDGREIPEGVSVPGQLHARAGYSGSFTVGLSTRAFREPGSYSGSIVLRADPNSAYQDPGIKEIWGGELAFPISFTIPPGLGGS